MAGDAGVGAQALEEPAERAVGPGEREHGDAEGERLVELAGDGGLVAGREEDDRDVGLAHRFHRLAPLGRRAHLDVDPVAGRLELRDAAVVDAADQHRPHAVAQLGAGEGVDQPVDRAAAVERAGVGEHRALAARRARRVAQREQLGLEAVGEHRDALGRLGVQGGQARRRLRRHADDARRARDRAGLQAPQQRPPGVEAGVAGPQVAQLQHERQAGAVGGGRRREHRGVGGTGHPDDVRAPAGDRLGDRAPAAHRPQRVVREQARVEAQRAKGRPRDAGAGPQRVACAAAARPREQRRRPGRIAAAPDRLDVPAELGQRLQQVAPAHARATTQVDRALADEEQPSGAGGHRGRD